MVSLCFIGYSRCTITPNILHTVGSDRGRQAGRGSNPNVLENTDSFASDPIGGTNIRRSLKHGRARSKKKYAGGV